jgi:thymidylate synthase (FAD)
MSKAKFRSDVTVQLMDHMGDEESIVRAARVSTSGADSRGAAASTGLVRFLYREGHGSPFEHNSLTFYIESPLFVGRQILRHRIGSFNEESGRYKELEGVFYLPHDCRKVTQIGKTGAYEFEFDAAKLEKTRFWIKAASRFSWLAYRSMLKFGVSKEVARMVLPVNTYSSMYYTTNLRSILNFLSLRKDWGPDAVHQSKAQDEISMVATQMAFYVQELFPTVWEMFVDSGYQAV